MALVTITVRDADDGSVDIRLESEPPFHLREDDENTPAQYSALVMLNAATTAADKINSVTHG